MGVLGRLVAEVVTPGSLGMGVRIAVGWERGLQAGGIRVRGQKDEKKLQYGEHLGVACVCDFIAQKGTGYVVGNFP